MRTLRASPSLVHHDLLVLGGETRPSGIYWLRLFEREGSHVAIVTEVPGNPGQSVTNATDRLMSVIESEFKVSPQRVAFYEVWPCGSPIRAPHVARITFRSETRWADSSWSAIRRSVGASVPALPVHAELYARVLKRGGGVFEERFRQIFEAIPSARLPPPHNPAQCAHGARMLAIAEDSSGDKGWSERTQRRAGRAFLQTLTPADMAACRYHAADWKAIVEQAIDIIATLGRQDEDAHVQAAMKAALPEVERAWLVSLFRDPVRIHPRGFTNGQHRACAMRFSGADKAIVVRRDQRLGTVCTDWTYEGGG